jgi:two-component system cell cycle sensor histidine kinase/response regulator CckA
MPPMVLTPWFLAGKYKIDVLVTDVVMAEMDGWALAGSMSKQYPHVPVVFISGYPVDIEGARRRYSNCTILAKPFQPTN